MDSKETQPVDTFVLPVLPTSASESDCKTFIRIHVKQGKDLAQKDAFSESDPYVIAIITGVKPNSSKNTSLWTGQSSVINDNNSPLWLDAFWTTDNNSLSDLTGCSELHLIIQIWDKDPMSSEFMGQVEFDLKEPLSLDDWFPVKPRSGYNDGEIKGDILVAVAYKPREKFLIELKDQKSARLFKIWFNNSKRYVNDLITKASEFKEAHLPTIANDQMEQQLSYTSDKPAHQLFTSGMVWTGKADDRPLSIKCLFHGGANGIFASLMHGIQAASRDIQIEIKNENDKILINFTVEKSKWSGTLDLEKQLITGTVDVPETPSYSFVAIPVIQLGKLFEIDPSAKIPIEIREFLESILPPSSLYL